MIMQGREILRSTVDLVQNNLNLEVISCTFISITCECFLSDHVRIISFV